MTNNTKFEETVTVRLSDYERMKKQLFELQKDMAGKGVKIYNYWGCPGNISCNWTVLNETQAITQLRENNERLQAKIIDLIKERPVASSSKWWQFWK